MRIPPPLKWLLKALYAPVERVQHERKFNRSPAGRRRFIAEQQTAVARWERAGRPVPPPERIKHDIIRTYAQRFNLRVLVETGTFVGDTPDALQADFDRIYTIELDRRLAAKARRRFEDQPHITVIEGDSSVVLRQLAPSFSEPVLFWLDGHWSGGVTAKGPEISPILSEIATVLSRNVPEDVLLIDDARLFGTEGYPSLDALRQKVVQLRPDWDVSTENDIIRAHAAPTAR